MTRRILLVEDDAAIADALRLHLEQSGYAMEHEDDGDRGLRAIDRRPWDLVLLDVMLPGTDGWALCRHLRQRYPAVPVIMLSARAAEAHRVLGLELGADDYLAKPFSMLELVARVRALFRRLETLSTLAPGSAVLHLGRLRLDAIERRLYDGDVEIELTPREFDLLLFLARHPGRAFGRDELLRRVWGSGFDGYEHTVNSHINRLRSKIEPDPRAPRHLLTVWGVGYRFEVA